VDESRSEKRCRRLPKLRLLVQKRDWQCRRHSDQYLLAKVGNAVKKLFGNSNSNSR
jgi:hypothetical protein